MSILWTNLKTEVVERDSKVIELQIKDYHNLYLFNSLVEEIKQKCNATIESESGGAIFNEWTITIRSNSRKISAWWTWGGISFLANDDLGREFLQEVEMIITAKKYFKLRLVIEERLG